MISAVTSLQKLIVPRLPMVTPGDLALALQRSAQEFCRRTGLWTKESAATDLVASTASYEITPESGAVASRLVWVKINGAEVPAYQYDLTATSSKQYVTFGADYVPTTSITGGLTYKFEQMPDDGSTTVSQHILVHYGECLADYAVWLLAKDPTLPTFNEAVAAQAYDDYRIRLGGAMHDRSVGMHRGSATATFDPWL